LKKWADKIKRVGLIANSEKVSCAHVVSRVARLLVKASRRICSDVATAKFIGLEAVVCPDAATLSRQVDLILVFGGDGTMLRVAREIAGSRTPMLGINIGGLGFLTAVSSEELPAALEQLWKGEVTLESRVLLEATGQCHAQRICQTALNDIVISRGIISRLIELDVRVDGDPLTRYRCDGLIASSATGSTAYSLAAGGAVVFPTAEVFALTPICPHTLSNRSLILPLSSTLEVKAVSSKPRTVLSADGQVVGELAPGETIIIRRSRRTVRLMHLANGSFCQTLRLKLHWRGATL
jgi:NAD+ kinase